MNGKEALQKIEARANPAHKCEKLRGVLMDCEMPVMNGLEATKELVQKINRGEVPLIPIIACTAFQGDEQKEACFEAGMSGYLTKPVMLEELRSTLAELGIID